MAEALRICAREQGLRPFSAEYFVKTITENITLRQVQKSLDYLCKSKEMIRLKNDRYLTTAAMEGIKKRVRQWGAEKGEIHLRDSQELLGFNREIGLHVLEYLDATGFTVKRGEGRIVIGKEGAIHTE